MTHGKLADDEPRTLVRLTYEKLVQYTDNFSKSNYIGHFQYGKLYRGKIDWLMRVEYVMVKIWEVPEVYNYEPGDNKHRLMDEIILLRHETLINHPGMVRLFGYCYEGECLAVVYEFKPFDSVFNLIPKDGFTWLQRIKTAFGFASLLKFLHERKSSFYKPFIVRNLDAAHIVLDEDYNPKLCDFGSITGGIFPDRTTYGGQHVLGCHGYIDISASGNLPDKQDVFAFGVILVSLISKEVYTEDDRQGSLPFVYEWAWREFEAYESDIDMEKPEFSLVHKNLAEGPDFCLGDGHKITALALKCVNRDECERPNMKQVVRSLLKLEVVKQHSHFLGLNNNWGVLRPCQNDTT
ncbi:hypothetical protein BUALT_Bualt12G0106500 [Buddleja alternifolia]|uniref:Protein kinase domain-containing protein n=1 Tax=Buddleja alternifolia TaxID=168488 RepID=A0AAV6WX03_9LAMI|nr:hypothetical protein BUALT_Bualt12G0106500 [Buddleja alternifolia]